MATNLNNKVIKLYVDILKVNGGHSTKTGFELFALDYNLDLCLLIYLFTLITGFVAFYL